MKMHCPICGSKLYNGSCPYCEVTEQQIIDSSFLQAKENIKNKNRHNVYYTTYSPKDINKKKVALYTLLLNAFGVADWYLGKKFKAWYHIISSVFCLLFGILHVVALDLRLGVEEGTIMLLTFASFFVAVGLIIWFNDIVRLAIKKTNVPVVLAPKPQIEYKPHKRNRVKIK